LQHREKGREREREKEREREREREREKERRFCLEAHSSSSALLLLPGAMAAEQIAERSRVGARSPPLPSMLQAGPL
jgi:hypothetical protein